MLTGALTFSVSYETAEVDSEAPATLGFTETVEAQHCPGRPRQCAARLRDGGGCCPVPGGRLHEQARRCAAGLQRTPSGNRVCCWPGQEDGAAFEGQRGWCTGRPTTCPAGWLAARNACIQPATCTDGRVASAGTYGQCCWSGQTRYENTACTGSPTACPAGRIAQGTLCLLPEHEDLGRSAAEQADMVEVPAGQMTTGGETRGHSVPGTTVALSRFWLDRHEVTVEAYADCVHTGACSTPNEGVDDGGRYVPYSFNWGVAGHEHHPVNGVTFDQAAEYCAWRNARLPTDQEWEYGARGTDGRTYPWGDSRPTRRRLQWGANGTAPVGIHPAGASPFGLLDMAGNVWEFVQFEEGTGYGWAARIRGGHFDSPREDLVSFYSTRVRRREGYSAVGFRCARDPE